MAIQKVNLEEKLNAIDAYWTPKITGELNGQLVKLARFKGEFIPHQHENEDELFLVIEGRLFIELADQTLELQAGEFVIIPRGTVHKPYAPEEASVLLFEPAATLNTGDQVNERTVTRLEKI